MKITKLHAENVHGYLPIDVCFFDDLTFITGLNGSGKTSALRLLMALLTPNINELDTIIFSVAKVTVIDNSQEIEVTAIKTLDGVIDLGISTIKEHFQITRSEVETFMDTKRSDEPSSKIKDIYKSNPVFHAILQISTPMFLGLDRRFYIPGSITDDFEEVRRREYMTRRYWSEESIFRSTAIITSLAEVNYLVVSRLQLIRAEQEQLDERLRIEFFTKAFEYKPTEFLSIKTEMPDREELNKYRQLLSKIEETAVGIKIPMPEIQTALTIFFEKMGQVVDSLEKKVETKNINYPKDKKAYQQPNKKNIEQEIPNKHLIEWVINKPQVDRIIEHLVLLTKYLENRNSLREPVDRFRILVNKFLAQTKKQIDVDSKDQLRILIDGNINDRRQIDALSSGERQLLVMLAHLSLNPNLDGSGVFIVDEPELSLHIDWQEKFVDAIREANPKVQLILATHSPAIILDNIEACITLNEEQHDY